MTERADPELLALYVQLYFDEDVSADIVANLRQRGLDVLCARDVELLQRDDDTQLAFAVSQGRVFVTHNRNDFEMRHRQYLSSGQEHFGIIIARRRFRPEHVVSRLLDILNQTMVDEMVNQLRYI